MGSASQSRTVRGSWGMEGTERVHIFEYLDVGGPLEIAAHAYTNHKDSGAWDHQL